MKETTVQEKTLKERVMHVRHVLTGENREYGLQAWFGREVEKRARWLPSETTLWRWFHGHTEIDLGAVKALEEMEAESEAMQKARDKFHAKQRA